MEPEVAYWFKHLCGLNRKSQSKQVESWVDQAKLLPLGCELRAYNNIEIIKLLNEMFDAKEAYGCGFYDDPAWTMAYDKLRNLVGRNNAFFHEESGYE